MYPASPLVEIILDTSFPRRVSHIPLTSFFLRLGRHASKHPHMWLHRRRCQSYLPLPISRQSLPSVLPQRQKAAVELKTSSLTIGGFPISPTTSTCCCTTSTADPSFGSYATPLLPWMTLMISLPFPSLKTSTAIECARTWIFHI